MHKEESCISNGGSILMMLVQGSAKKSSPLLCQSEVSASQMGLSSFHLGN
jgi:hypothetical protein